MVYLPLDGLCEKVCESLMNNWHFKRRRTLELLTKGYSISYISKDRKVHASVVYKARQYLINKGYLTSDIILTEDGKTFLDSHGSSTPLLVCDTIRYHGLGFKMLIRQKTLNWESERNKVITLGVRHYDAQSLPLRGWTKYQYRTRQLLIKTTPKSIELWYLYDVTGKTEPEASKSALMQLLKQHIPQVERTFNIKLVEDNKVSIQIISQHLALIKNHWAKMYRLAKQKLYVPIDGRLTYVIDFSHHIDELEAVDPRSAPDDIEGLTNALTDIKKGQADRPRVTKAKLEDHHKILDEIMPILRASADQINEIATMQANQLKLEDLHKKEKEIAELKSKLEMRTEPQPGRPEYVG